MMMAILEKWLAPPVFPDDEARTRRASLLNIALLCTIIFAVGSCVANLVNAKISVPLVVSGFLLVTLALLSRYWMYQGKVTFASLLVIFIGFVYITATSVTFGTLRTPATAIYGLIIIVAGLLFGSIGTLGSIGASSLAVLGLVLAENAGWLAEPDYSVTLTQWIMYTIFFGAIGGITHWALGSLHQELAERKHAEIALRESEQNFGAFFNSIDDLLFVLDTQGNILWSNATVSRRLQYTADELRGQSVLMVHPPEHRNKAGQIVADMLAGKADHCPVPVQAKDGTLIPVETRIVPGTWSGRPAIFGVTKDLSALKASEEKFARAFNASPALMAINDLQTGIYLEVNDAFLRTLGYPREQIIGHTSHELNLFADPAQRGRALQLIQEQGFLHDFEVGVYSSAGQILHGLFSAEYIQLQDRRVLLTVMSDLSEFKREEARIKLRLRLDNEAHRLSESELVQLGLEEAVRLTNSAIGYCHFINPDANTIQLITWSQATLEKFCTAVHDSHYPLDAAGVWADCSRTGQPVIHNDFQSLPDRKGYPAGHSHVIRHLSVPVFEETHIKVILGVGNKLALYTEADVRLLQLIGDDVWSVIRRKRAEEQLRASEQQLQNVVANNIDGMMVVDENGVICFINPAAAALLNQSAANLIGQAFGLPVTMGQSTEIELVRATGDMTIVEMRMTQVRWQDMPAQLVSMRDITERKRLEHELEAERDFVLQVMNTMGQGLTITNNEGNFEFVNPAYSRLMGYEPTELVGKSPRDVTMPMDRAVLEQAFEERKQGKITWYESQLIHKDGTIKPVLVTGVPRAAVGMYTGSIAVITDLTERKRAEEQLRASEELYRQMFATHSAMMLLVEPNSGMIVDANLAAAEFYGYPLETLRQMDINQINALPTNQVAQARQAALTRQQNYFVFSHRLASGELRDVELYSVPIQTQQRTLLYSIIHDITARLSAEAQLRYLSTHDSLTGLYNRAFFESETRRLEQGREFPLSIVIADVDNMKITNDTRGHLAGDALLERAAQVFRATFRASDIIARIGGDEFAILLPDTDAIVADQVLARVRYKLAKIRHNSADPLLQLSLGVATAEHGNVMEAFRAADAHMYADKRKHKTT